MCNYFICNWHLEGFAWIFSGIGFRTSNYLYDVHPCWTFIVITALNLTEHGLL